MEWFWQQSGQEIIRLESRGPRPYLWRSPTRLDPSSQQVRRKLSSASLSIHGNSTQNLCRVLRLRHRQASLPILIRFSCYREPPIPPIPHHSSPSSASSELARRRGSPLTTMREPRSAQTTAPTPLDSLRYSAMCVPFRLLRPAISAQPLGSAAVTP